MIGYLDPSAAAVGYVGAVAVNMALGGSNMEFSPAVKFFADMHENQPTLPKQTYSRASRAKPYPVRYEFDAYRTKYTEKGNFAFVLFRARLCFCMW